MNITLLDHPLVLSTLFYPTLERSGTSRRADVRDGTIPVEEGIVLGYRLYPFQPGAPVILYFHGNGETASNHDYIASEYHAAGASLLVVDYRGYGWSTGTPKVSALLTDIAPIMDALPGILTSAGLLDQKLFVMGRSLGSAPAIHAAHHYPDRFKGIIIESGFAYTLPLLPQLGLPATALAALFNIPMEMLRNLGKMSTEELDHLPDPIGNARKMAEIHLPLLVIHGERDNLLPVMNGQALYDKSPAVSKRILRIVGAGHNDLMFMALDRYFAAIAEFLSNCLPSQEENS